ncbi:MAG: 50S ribosomal protein L14e [Candidatus Thorarchaeota archaeon SMTZ-45]|nr:MAG: 50S ribosomal protein L14e [Candidatus Thorarchaeota archaeon SMTZ1-45]KXH75173.1 MAG: 50S ribosomal protein L14e [Candidatus Thorarchaeota archaeon SMTZ-45]
MGFYETGRVCVKTMGREAGSLCVVVSMKDDSYVVITGPKHLSGVRRRSCNTRHLEPLETILSITSDADDKAVEKAIEEAGLIEKFRTKIRIEM